jgi:hypothetical protein
MTGNVMKNAILVGLVAAVALFVVYQYDPTMFGLLSQYDGFQDAHGAAQPGHGATSGPDQLKQMKKEAFEDKKKEEKKEKFEDKKKEGFEEKKKEGFEEKKDKEGFADLGAFEGPANFGSADAPAGCYPRDQLTPSELLPKDMNSVWAEQNPMGPGSLKGKNFLSAGALLGVNTVGQSLRNANLQLRSEPPNPQVQVSIFNQSTISPDISHRALEIGA